MEIEKKKEIVKLFIKNKVLLDEEVLQLLDQEQSPEKILDSIKEKISSDDFLILNKDLKTALHLKEKLDVNFKELDRSKALAESDKDSKIYKCFVDYLKSEEDNRLKKEESIAEDNPVKVVFNYGGESKKRDIKDFVQYFNQRYKRINEMLRSRRELQNITSINRVLSKNEKDSTAVIGLVVEKTMTKNDNIRLTIEDPTGQIPVIITKNKPELYEQAKDIVEDEVIGVVGVNGENIIFANGVVWPDIPTQKELKKSPRECYAVFISDLHIGSIKFLPEQLNKFLKWINCEIGNESQKSVARKVKYCFITGDLVDGIGVYPGQEDELEIFEIKQQYEECAKFLRKIPERIKLIIIPGNHDAMRLAEPQPPLYKDFAKPIWALPNAVILSNPAMVNIESVQEFQGINCLLYHGYSFIYYADNIESIRQSGGIDRSDLIMKFWLKRRHLAPAHTSTLYIPETEKDPLVIDKLPDILITGHIHKAMIANYRNVTMICGSCWQEKTSFEERLGLHPEPAKVPIINLQTREVKILNFG
ncbi:DNA-directed DNA polymerase II small subunit [Candidatus Woesearchaeota archaeon]|nr:DNA-directed DNA polymerase II small subunit [Candidatus Woesearchaeota archaeon]